MNQRQIAFIKIIVTSMLWGTTYVLVRIGLEDLHPIMLAGLRYTLAGLLLLPVLAINKLKVRDYRKFLLPLAILGILSFTLGNGFSGLALVYLPSTTVSLMSNLTSPMVLVFGFIWLKEKPRFIQVLGLLVAMAGMVVYFYPLDLVSSNPGYLAAFLGLVAFTASALLARYLARSGEVPFLVQTSIPFIIGGGILIVWGLITNGIPILTVKAALIIITMALFNSITGYILYNQALSVLTAVEVNVILRSAPFFTAVYAWLLLGESITPRQFIAMIVVFLGIFLVQKGPSMFYLRPPINPGN